MPVTLIHLRDRVYDKEAPSLVRLHRRVARTRRRDPPAEFAGDSRARRRGRRRAHVIEVEDGDPVKGHEILLAIGRDLPLDGLGLETIGATAEEGRLSPDDRLRVAENVYAVGDAGGPELHTHLGHYTGEAAARIALGD